MKLINGKVDLSRAYDDKIGAFDKVTIAYGYQVSGRYRWIKALNDIVQQSSGRTYLLSDGDGRPIGGAHTPHLWDNGRDAAENSTRVMEVGR